MKKKTYESPWMDIVFIHTYITMLTGSVMTPGADNEPPSAPDYPLGFENLL
jgi:hypothetical protein